MHTLTGKVGVGTHFSPRDQGHEYIVFGLVACNNNGTATVVRAVTPQKE